MAPASPFMSGSPKVLAVTKRPAHLCAATAQLNGYGFEVSTVTNLDLAIGLARRIDYQAAVVCRHSLTDSERDHIVAGLEKSSPGLRIIARCPGCTGCDEAQGVAGKLDSDEAIVQIATTLKPR
jgi:hypothetical protein